MCVDNWERVRKLNGEMRVETDRVNVEKGYRFLNAIRRNFVQVLQILVRRGNEQYEAILVQDVMMLKKPVNGLQRR